MKLLLAVLLLSTLAIAQGYLSIGSAITVKAVPVRCTISPSELATQIRWDGPAWTIPGIEESAVALVIDYRIPVDAIEVTRCIQQMADSSSTQEYFKRWINRPRVAKVNHQWEIWVMGKLVSFVGVPEAAK